LHLENDYFFTALPLNTHQWAQSVAAGVQWCMALAAGNVI